MACSIQDVKNTLKEVAPLDLSSLSANIAGNIPRDQDTKINAGPFGNVTRIELRGKLKNYIDEAFDYSNFLYVLLRGPLSVNKDYTTSFADACNKYKFVIRSKNSSYLNPAFYQTFDENLVIEDAFDPNTGIQTMPKYQNAYKLCVELFSTKECPRELGLQLIDERRYDLEFAAVLYAATYNLERGGRKARNARKANPTRKHSKKPKRKTLRR
jgi:hypothetical protein